MKIKSTPYSNLVAVLANLVLIYLLYMVTRVAFVLENWTLYSAGWGSLSLGEVFAGSLRFDSSAIFYTNALWLLLMLLPLHLKERPWWHSMCKWLFVVVNSIGLSINLIDAVYSKFTGRRTTATFFSEFSNEDNLGSIIGGEMLSHWYLVLLGVVLIAALWLLYAKPYHSSVVEGSHLHRGRYYVAQSVALAIVIPMTLVAMRGGFTSSTRPITISNANQYVRSPQQAAIVLNTPFSLIRTIGKKPFKNPHFFPDDEVETLYSPLHVPQGDALTPLVKGQKNVVVIILESFSREFVGFYHRDAGDDYEGYTPFLDSLLAHSLTFEHTFANGRKSIDAMPSALSSVPYFVEPFILTPSSLNDLSGLADCLGKKGYSSAFYHGAPNSSMGFQAFSRSSGFQKYLGMSEYCDDPRTGGDDDFDGHWAIWDEEFLQFFATTLGEQLTEPFMAGLFTASSHHPFRVPARYEGRFPEGTRPLHHCIGYSDNALRHFFATAKKQPWYNNTLFVLTADHTNQIVRPESLTSLGPYSIPIAIYDPSGELPRGLRPGVMQQIDIMPTILRILGYDKPYMAFGRDVLDTTATPWAVNYGNDIYQYIMGDYVLLFDGQQPTALYNYVADPLQKNDLLATEADRAQEMTTRLKMLIQSYMIRMTTNNLVVRDEVN